MPNWALESDDTMTPEVRCWAGLCTGSKSRTFAVVLKRSPGSGESAPRKLGSKGAMPVRPAYSESRNVSTELPIGVMHPKPVTTTRINESSLLGPHARATSQPASGRRRIRRRCSAQALHAADHISHWLQRVEAVIGNLDAKHLLHGEAEVDFVQRINLQCVERAVHPDVRCRQDLRLGDEFDDSGLDVVHTFSHTPFDAQLVQTFRRESFTRLAPQAITAV